MLPVSFEPPHDHKSNFALTEQHSNVRLNIQVLPHAVWISWGSLDLKSTYSAGTKNRVKDCQQFLKAT